MRCIATDVANSVVSCVGHRWAVQKRVNRWRCRLGADYGRPKEPCITWGPDSPGELAILGVVRTIQKQWETAAVFKKRINRSVVLGMTHVGPRKHVVDGIKVGQIKGRQDGCAAFQQDSMTVCYSFHAKLMRPSNNNH